MNTAAALRSPERAAGPLQAPSRRYRTEVQGLRAVAIALVVLYHVFLDRVSGGVDVFLLISAFLLTGTFVDRMERREGLGIGSYWVRVFKRLLPPAAVTIVAVVVLMRVFFPAFRWREILSQALASLFYVENWHLAATSVDYYAADRAVASPLQHFWSLSIQGQVFLVWPLLFVLATVITRLTTWSIRRTLTTVFGMVFAVSLAWSVWSTATAQAHAYFDTFTRLWEFALGSLLAIWLPVLERRHGFGPGTPRPSVVGPRVAAGWVGMLGIISCGILVNVAGAFPGWIALWPLLSACLVIGAGHTGTRWGVDHWLSTRPLRKLADLSYALYLVHWPILITVLLLKESSHAAPLEGVFIVMVSLHLAWLLTRFVDGPVRTSEVLRARPLYAVLVISVAMAGAAAPVTLFRTALDRQSERAIIASSANNPGAAVLTGASQGPADPAAPVVPLIADIGLDWMALGETCRGNLKPKDPALASACQESAGGDPDRVIVAVGNSRVQQFLAALAPLAEQRDHKVVSLLKHQCYFTLRGVPTECMEWNQDVVDHILQVRPEAVYTTTTYIDASGREMVYGGTTTAIEQLTAAGIDVIGLRDQPRIPYNPALCLHDHSLEDCTVPTEGMFDPEDPNAALAKHAVGPGRFHPVDLTPWICPDGQCVPAIGNVHVYLDGNHLSQVYSRTLAPVLDQELAATGWRW